MTTPTPNYHPGVTPFGLTAVQIRGYRSLRQAGFEPAPVSTLVGEASSGKSNLLAALRSLLDPQSAPIVAGDMARDGEGAIRIEADLADGSSRLLQVPGHGDIPVTGPEAPPTLFLPASLRTGRVVAPFHHGGAHARRAAEILRAVIPALSTPDREPPSERAATEAAHGLVEGLESWNEAGLTGLILLIEEPELFLPPQTQRYLYRLLRLLATSGNQVIYSTHSPSFMNVARLDELVFTERRSTSGTRLHQPEPLPPDEEFRAYSEFDAARGELFLARAAVLVEGLTEKLALPFVFRAMGYDVDRERISIVECGGKSNIPLIAGISKTVGIPFVAVHDRDAPPGKSPNAAERQLNGLIEEVAGPDNRIELAPDFEGATGLRGHRHKPARAWRTFSGLAEDTVPEPLRRIVQRAIELARG